MFSASDECANAVTTNANLIIVDTQAPRIAKQPWPELIECDRTTNENDVKAFLATFGGAEATDMCSNDAALIWKSDGAPEFATVTECIHRAAVRWTVNDECGNEASASTFLSITDTTLPTFVTDAQQLVLAECPSQVDYTAKLEAWLDDNGGAVAEDACSEYLTWSYSPANPRAQIDSSTCPKQVTVTFTAEDDCGLQITTSNQFTIEDDIAPIVTVEPNDMKVGCNEKGSLESLNEWLRSFGGMQANDECFPSPPRCPEYENNKRKADCSYCDPNPSIVCIGNTSHKNLCFAYCKGHVNTDTSYTMGICEETVTNTADKESNSPPSMPAETLNPACNHCYNDNDPVCAGGTRNYFNPCFAYCDGDWAFEFGICNQPVTPDPNNVYVATHCSWCTKAAQSPANVICGSDGKTYPSTCHAACEGVDNYYYGACVDVATCGKSTLDWRSQTDGNEVNIGKSCNVAIEATFKVRDPCGNEVARTATFSVVDNDPPTYIREADDAVVECDLEGNTESITLYTGSRGGSEATDGCKGDAVSWRSAVGISTGNKCKRRTSLEFFAHDDCDNEATATRGSLIVVDTKPPRFTTEADDLIITCSPDVDVIVEIQMWIGAHGNSAAVDDCRGFLDDDVTLEYGTEHLQWTIPTIPSTKLLCNRKQHFKFTVNDECSNKASTTGSVTLIDTTTPVLYKGAKDKTVDCNNKNDGTLTSWLESNAGAEALETCTAVKWSYTTPVTLEVTGQEPPASCKEVVVTFTATDECSNAVETRPVKFSVVDTVSPLLSLPENKVVECKRDGSNLQDYQIWIDAHGGASADDECETISDLQWRTSKTAFEPISTLVGCSDSMSTMTVTVSDTCGNENNSDVNFTIVDTFPPSLVGKGSSLTHYCDARCDDMVKENANVEKLFEQWVDIRHGCLGVADCNSIEWSYTAHQREIDKGTTTGMIEFEKGDTFDSSSLCGKEGSVRLQAKDACGNTAFRLLQFSFPIIHGIPIFAQAPKVQTLPTAPSPQVQCDICSNSGGKGSGKATVSSLTFTWSGASGTTIAVSGATLSSAVLLRGGTVTISASKLPTNLMITVGGQDRKFHTSCSQPIYLGLSRAVSGGELVLVDFNANGMTKAAHCPSSVYANSNDAAGCCYMFEIDGSDILYSGHNERTRDECEETTAADNLSGERFEPKKTCAALIGTQTALTAEIEWSPDSCSTDVKSIDVCSRLTPPVVHEIVVESTTQAPVSCSPAQTNICGNAGYSRPNSVTFRYVEGGSTMSSNQGGKSSVTGSSSGTASITLYSNSQRGTAVVQPGQEFAIGNGGGLDTETMFIIASAAGSQRISIHTSCSEPMYVGDQYGGLKLVDFDGQAPISETCGPVSVSQCSICSADGYNNRPTSLIVMYTSQGANVNQQGSKAYGAITGSFPKEATVSANGFSLSVSDGQSFQLSGNFGTEITFTIGSIGSVSFHTSCSVPLYTGDRFGPFTIIGGGACVIQVARVASTSAGGVGGCCYVYSYAPYVGAFVYGNYIDTTFNHCSAKLYVGGGIAFDVSQTCNSLKSKHNTQKSGCCFKYLKTVSVLSATVYTYSSYVDSVEYDCIVDTTVSGATGEAGTKFELGTSCSLVKLQHQGADVRCQTCDSSDDARPTMLTFRYVGGSKLTNPQNGVAMVEQDVVPVGIGAVIKCFGSSGGVYFDRSSVLVYAALDSAFTVGLGGNQVLDYITTCEVNTGAQLAQGTGLREHTQTITFATACHFGGSLNIGDTFGSIQLTGYQTYDKNLNKHVSGPGAGAQCTQLIVEPENPKIEYEEELNSDEGCVQDICASLDENGSVLKSLVLQLNLADSRIYANGQATWKGGESNKNAFFNPKTGSNTAIVKTTGMLLKYKETLIDGDRFEISAEAYGHKKLGKHITFLVQDPRSKTYKTKIKVRTKCDYPLNVGDKFGVLEVVGYVGTNDLFCLDVALTPQKLIGDGNHTITRPASGVGPFSDGAFAGVVLAVVAVFCLVGAVIMVRSSAKGAFDMWIDNNIQIPQSQTCESEVSELKWDSSYGATPTDRAGMVEEPTRAVSSVPSSSVLERAALEGHPKWNLFSLFNDRTGFYM
jgi:hypothetical protein